MTREAGDLPPLLRMGAVQRPVDTCALRQDLPAVRRNRKRTGARPVNNPRIRAGHGNPPLMKVMEHTGALRVYFNRLSAAPMMWCVSPDSADDGTWEIAVRLVTIGPGVISHATWRPKVTPDDEDGRPSAWLATRGHLTIFADGTATITSP